MFEIRELYAAIGGKEVIKGVNLKVNDGEVHVIMGPNGSGKTTLAKAILGHPGIKITKGDMLFNNQSILQLPTDKRAALGLFLGFQNPVEIEGVGFVNLLRASREAIHGSTSMKELMQEIKSTAQNLKIEESIIGRPVNKGFSGGEKKKAEALQMILQKPKLAILDEPDSGLDIDALKIVASNIRKAASDTHCSLIVITHYNRILSYIMPQYVHVMIDGKMVAEGNHEMIEKLEKEGYKPFEGK